MAGLAGDCRLCDSVQCASQVADRRLGPAQSVPLRKPRRIVVGQPGAARCILPNQCLQRQVDPDGLGGLHQGCAAPGISKNQKLGRVQRQTRGGGAGRMIDPGKTVMPLAFTAVSSLFMVSRGPWLLLMVVNPRTAICLLP